VAAGEAISVSSRELVFCNTCRRWRPPPYRRGRCAACMGVWVGGLKCCCGDCDCYPCECPGVDDFDVALAVVA
jgi:hypothetical protein